MKNILYKFRKRLQNPRFYFNRFYSNSVIRKILIPFVLNEPNINVLSSKFTDSNYLILTENYFYKVARFNSTIDDEILNFNKLKKLKPIVPFLPAILEYKKLTFRVLKTSKLESLDSNDILDGAFQILKAFRANGESTRVKYDDFQTIQVGLNVIEKYYGVEWVNRIREALVKIFTNSLFIGPTHGDFHYENILKTMAGDYKIIDFDCYNDKGIQILDAITLNVFYEAKKNNISWYRQLVEYEKADWKILLFPEIFREFVNLDFNYIGVLFTINLLGIENRYFDLNLIQQQDLQILLETLKSKNRI